MKNTHIIFAGVALIVVFLGAFLYVNTNIPTETAQTITNTDREKRMQQIQEMQQTQKIKVSENVVVSDTPEETDEAWQPPVTKGQKVSFVGHYKPYVFYDDMSGENVSCHGFKVVGGDIHIASQIVMYGADAHVINLNWDLLKEEDKVQIENSSLEEPVTISFSGNEAGPAKGIPACRNHWLTLTSVAD